MLIVVYMYVPGLSPQNTPMSGNHDTLTIIDQHSPSSSTCILFPAGEKNFIGVGVCNKAYPADLLPGWEETSIAIHTEDGSIFTSSDDAEPLGLPCGKGCVIKCSLVADPQDSACAIVEFFKDGERVKSVAVRVPEGGFHGIVGMMSRGEKIQISPPVVTWRAEFSHVWVVCTPQTIQHQSGGLCSYVGPGYLNEESIGTVRTKERIDPFGPLSQRSFEIRIIDPGEKAYIAIGICSQEYPHNMLPGWKEISVGYHADNGSLFYSSDNGQPTDHPCKKGDTMRCTVHPADGSQKQVMVAFHRNNQVVGKLTAWTPENGFYGCFGMMTKRECVEVALPEISEPYVPPRASFLDVWEALTPSLQYQENGVFAYSGEGGPDSVGTVRSKAPIDPLNPNNFFEVKIIDPGDMCYIALGVCSPQYPATQLPGWAEISVGFHMDNGLILNGGGAEYKETECNCVKGDVLRCTLEPVDGSHKQVNVIFHRNSAFVGKTMFWNPRHGLYAQVSSMSKGEVIQIASPQTEPASLTPDSPSRSMSVPVPHNPKDGMREKQFSVPNFSRMTPAPGSHEPSDPPPFPHPHGPEQFHGHRPHGPEQFHGHRPHGTEHFHGHRPHGTEQFHGHRPHGTEQFHGHPPPHHPPPHHPYTAPISPYSYHPHPPHRMPFDPRMFGPPHFRPPHPMYMKHHMEQRARHPHDFYQDHMPSMPPSGSSTGRHYPHPPLVPVEHAETASPLPFQPADGHPLGQQGATPAAHRLQPHDARHDPYYASQASVASAASDSDAQYRSQISAESQQSEDRAHATSGAYGDTSHSSEQISRGHGNWVQPRSPGPTQKAAFSMQPSSEGAFTAPVKPVAPTFRPDHSTTVNLTDAEASISLKHVAETAFDYPDSPITPKKPPPEMFEHHPPAKTLERASEPVKQVTVTAEPPPVRLLTKQESSLCRVLYNVSCGDNNSLQCTLPADSPDSSFAMCRLQLTEKMPYFEVELEKHDIAQNVVVGLVPRDHSHTIPIGTLPSTIAYHTATGSLIAAGQESSSISNPCSAGDVIGCRVEWTYKLEACDPNQESLVKVEWFRNGCSIAIKSIRVPASGLYPALGMTTTATTVKLRHSMGLKPESYFNSHPLPDNFTNIEVPLHTAEGWNCIQNAQIDEDDYIVLQEDHSSLPTVVQGSVPFTTVKPYFEVELQHHISSVSVLAVGALETISNLKQIIPGDAPNSIGLFPLLGFVMRNGSISSNLPEDIVAEIKNSSEKLRIGVGVDFHPTTPSYTSTTRRVKVFFTINGQQINSTYVAIPQGGLCPTIAVDSDFRKKGERLVLLEFSHLQPQVSTLPLGFVHAQADSFKLHSRTVIGEKKLPEGRDTPQALQAALPFSQSHTYFELRIYRCDLSSVFSCGLAPRNSSLSCHPGNTLDSIGFYSKDGTIHQSGKCSAVSPPCSYRGAKIGCGARFPTDGSSKYMEVFFTLDGNMIARKIVAVPPQGLFPTVGFYTKGRGVVSIDISAADPFPDLQFSTAWRELRSMKAEGAHLQTTSSSQPCMAQLVQAVSLNTPSYFTIKPLSEISGRVLVGFSNCTSCPLLDDYPSLTPEEDDSSSEREVQSVLLQTGWNGCIVDVVTGAALVQDKLCRIITAGGLEQFHQCGCGIEPIKNTNSHLFFITVNDQVVFCKTVHLTIDPIFPIIFVSGPPVRISVDACALWPLQTPIGKGWARVKHLVLDNSKIKHIATSQRIKIPVGFAQAALPVIASVSYFEVEVCSRSVDKAIAIGLASGSYPSSTWVGWKPNSIAYHLDDGNLFTGSGMYSHKIGPKIFQGHTVGCGIVAKSSDSEINEGKKVEVFFTVNGAVIVEQKVTVPSGGFYPTVCLESPTESIVFHRYPQFPPVRNLVGSNWGNVYSVHQAGMVLEHSCRHREVPKGVPRGFCQASHPFSPDRSYFEIKIVGFSDASVLQAGVAVLIPLGCRTANVDSLMYSCAGHVHTRTGGNKSTTGAQKCGVGDSLGCAVNFSDEQPTSVDFYLNNMKVLRLQLSENWKGNSLFPTITLSHPGDAVLPMLGLSPPQWDRSSLIGWLRTERVRVKGNVAEYRPSTAEKNEVGLCQISQCLEDDSNSCFEVEILDPGKKCNIAVGAACADYPNNVQPGWKQHSIAYHGDDGSLFNEDPHGVPFGPVWRERDIIGVGVRKPAFESTDERETQVYFTRNGQEIGHTTVTVPPSGLFPTVGFHSPGEKVKITLNPSSSLGNVDPAAPRWRTLCGVQLLSYSQENQYKLRFFDNGRKTPRTGAKIALAIFGEAFSEKLHYFEVDLLSMGPDNSVAIGVVPKNYLLDHAPGWIRGSVAYHTDNGQLYHSRDRGKVFGPIAKRGDVIGCGVNFIQNNDKQCSIYFTYNGVEIGRVRTAIPKSGFFPSVCLTQKRDKVQVRMLETFKPKVSITELHMVGLMRISNCSYSDQIVQFNGGNTSQNSAPGIAQFAVPMHKDRNYFTAHILKADDTILIGLAVRDYPLKYVPGSTSISVAYDITKGSIRAVFDSNNYHKFDALNCTVGDRVGCGVISSDSKTEPGFVYFTRNGSVMKKIQFAEIFEDLYPIVGFVAIQRSSLLFMDWNMPLFDCPNLLSDC